MASAAGNKDDRITNVVEPVADPQAGQGLQLSFACPECERDCWVPWEHLARGLRCPSCQCRFGIDSSGHLSSQRRLPELKFVCPRCGERESLPATAAERGVTCTACQLRLLPGPEGRLYTAQELAEAKRKVVVQMKDARAAAPQRRGQAWMLGAAACAGVLLLLVGVWAWSGGSSVESAARAFTYECLAGKHGSADSYVVPQGFQQQQIGRWRMLHFASIVDQYRPSGDQVTVEVESLAGDEQERELEVTLTSPFLGQRRLRQYWKLNDDRWWFDAATSLDPPKK